MSRRERLARARLYVIATPAALGDDWERRVAAALASGAVDLLQLRAKAWQDERIVEVATRLQAMCRRNGALFVLNDRIDLAATIDADGVHVGEDDAPVVEARRVLGAHRLVGCSTHDAVELGAVQGADYAGLGPCFPTASKSLARTPGGAALVRAALPHAPAGLPVFPIGGIDEGNLPALIQAGATRAALGAGVLSQPDPGRAATRIRALLQAAADAMGADRPSAL